MTEAEVQWIVYEWRQKQYNSVLFEQIPQAQRDLFIQALPEDVRTRIVARGDESIAWNTCQWLHYQYSEQEAKRLGYSSIGVAAHDPYIVIEEVKGEENARLLAQKYGIPKLDVNGEETQDYEPTYMWDMFSMRQDGDAIVALYGDDRGSMNDPEPYLFTVIATWNPPHFQQRAREEFERVRLP